MLKLYGFDEMYILDTRELSSIHETCLDMFPFHFRPSVLKYIKLTKKEIFFSKFLENVNTQIKLLRIEDWCRVYHFAICLRCATA